MSEYFAAGLFAQSGSMRPMVLVLSGHEI